MSNIKELKKKHASYKAKLTLFEKYLKSLCTCDKLSSIQISELGARLQKVVECYGEYDSIQIHIESMTDISDAECQEEYEERERFESQYFAAVAKARDMLGRPVSADVENDPESSITGSVLAAEWQKRARWQRNERELLQLGNLVVVKEDRLPPNRWLLGHIIQLHPGSDGIACVVSTSSGVLRRAYNRLCLLPTSHILEQVPTGGAC